MQYIYQNEDTRLTSTRQKEVRSISFEPDYMKLLGKNYNYAIYNFCFRY